jgi:uncharacterized protein YjbI with pentapeptide repeats
MANEAHLTKLKEGVEAWNEWRRNHVGLMPDLSGEDLAEVDLAGADLAGANLTGAHLAGAHLTGANLTGANLAQAHLAGAILMQADLDAANLTRADLATALPVQATLAYTHLTGARLAGAILTQANLAGANLDAADLTGAHLDGANLTGASLTGANLTGANLAQANLAEANLAGASLGRADLQSAALVQTNLEGANLTGCQVYGISAWGVNLTGTQQSDLVITADGEPVITVDTLEVAQFIYLLLHNEKIREVIDTITSKAVLILGRFPPERKAVLDAMRGELRRRHYLPILFDCEVPGSRDFTETISTLAHMVRFIIADLTEPSSLPKEFEAIVPTLAVPVQPVMEGVTRPDAMFPDDWKYPWVLPVYRYDSLEGFVAALGEKVIVPAEVKVQELEATRKAIAEALLKQRPG